MKKVLFILMIFCQYTQIQAQTINLAISHNPSKKPVIYVVDFLQLDSAQISSIQFQRNDIKGIKTEGSKIIITTRLLVVLNGVLLSNQKEKKEKLSIINKKNIEYMSRIDKEKAFELYDIKGKSGALLIKTKNK